LDLDNKIGARILPNVVRRSIVGFFVAGIRDSLSHLLQVRRGSWSDKAGKRRSCEYSGYLVSTIFKLLPALSRT
jgi:hypothetical protein